MALALIKLSSDVKPVWAAKTLHKAVLKAIGFLTG